MKNPQKIFRKIIRFLALLTVCFVIACSIGWLRRGDFAIGRGDGLIVMLLALVGSEVWIWIQARKRRKLLAKASQQPDTSV